MKDSDRQLNIYLFLFLMIISSSIQLSWASERKVENDDNNDLSSTSRKSFVWLLDQRPIMHHLSTDKDEDVDESSPKFPHLELFSPRKLGMQRRWSTNITMPLQDQITLDGGVYWFGSQMDWKGKIAPMSPKDGAQARKRAKVKSFAIDVDCVTNAQFLDFVLTTGYITEAEGYHWSFVLEGQTSAAVLASVDSKRGMGRVRDARHWMAVLDANWMRPYGPDSNVLDILDYPAVHISFNDADEYCAWAGRRLPSEKEWEYAARGGRVNETYPWGNDFDSEKMNIWKGSEFPNPKRLSSGHQGLVSTRSYEPNDYGLYNMLGNVWEWVKGGTAAKRILRGGSFIDSKDGRFNHAVMVSTRQTNAGDSSASNLGFRCASDASPILEAQEDDQNLKLNVNFEAQQEF